MGLVRARNMWDCSKSIRLCSECDSFGSFRYQPLEAVVQKILAVALVFLLSFSANGVTLDANGTREIEHLLSHLKSSNCQFNRNGNWYPADKASEHLRTKYEYFLDKGELDSAESFIDKAASSSSMSGKNYLVSCAGHETEKSSSWLRQVLAQFRKERLANK